jgi:hypothetical protein
MSRIGTSTPRPGTQVTFPDGTSVYALNIDSRNGSYPPPDFGLYLDWRWRPTWNAVVIPWEDFEELEDTASLFEQVRVAFERAKIGQWVEIGCLAGCGRTGTALACMAVLAGIPAQDAVRWVRTNYDQDAVETSDQIDLVGKFAGAIQTIEHSPRSLP